MKPFIRSLLLVSALCSPMLMSGCQPAFDKQTWASGRGNVTPDNPRQGLEAAARQAGVRPGASRAVVRDLLGPPDREYAAVDLYDLGGINAPLERHALRIEYDANGVVTVVKHIYHDS
jgi:hypothetical protein